MHSIVVELVIIVGLFIIEIPAHILYLPSFGFFLCVLFVKLLIDWMDCVKIKKREVVISQCLFSQPAQSSNNSYTLLVNCCR